MNSRLFEEILQEATHSWKLNENDRSWFIGPGEIWSDLSHRLMLKNKFSKEWNDLKNRGLKDGDIEDIFADRLIKQGWIKIGELKDFYCLCQKLNQREKDILQGFCNSWLLVKPEDKNKIMTINGKHNLTFDDISKDILINVE